MLNDTADNSTSTMLMVLSVFRIFHAILYVVMFILGVIGNVSVFFIISRRGRQSATSIFLLNLSIGDLMMALFCVPITLVSDCLLHHWVFGHLLCRLIPFIQGVSVFLSAMSHMVISIDRYFVVFHPLKRQNFPVFGAMVIMMCMWMFAIFISSPMIYVMNIVKSQDMEFCRENWSLKLQQTYTLIVMVLQYFKPVFVIVLTYSAIAVRIWFSQTPGESIRSRDEAIATSKKKMIKMFIIVAIFYAFSQLPRHLITLASIYYDSFWNDTTVFIVNNTHLLSMSACFYNPILYIWLNSSFRKSFTTMMVCRRSSSLPPTSPRMLHAFPETQSCKQRKLSTSSNNVILAAKNQQCRFQ